MPHYSPTTGECTDRSTDEETRAAKTALARYIRGQDDDYETLHPHLRHLTRREIVNIARVTHLVAMQNATAARGA